MRTINSLCRRKDAFILQYQGMKLFSVLTIVLLSICGCRQEWIIDDPYGNVDWQKHEQYTADLHAHTTISEVIW
jgi:hypothetical protein